MRRTSFPLPATWDRAGLEAVGFVGFVPLEEMKLRDVPQAHGVYRVDLKQVPRRLGKLVLVLFTWSIYGTIVPSVLVVAALVVFAFFGGGFGG